MWLNRSKSGCDLLRQTAGDFLKVNGGVMKKMSSPLSTDKNRITWHDVNDVISAIRLSG